MRPRSKRFAAALSSYDRRTGALIRKADTKADKTRADQP
jgi:hypothetical protein